MSSEKSLLKRLSVRPSRRKHRCRRSQAHLLPKDALMLVVKEDRNEFHYCAVCAEKFIATARKVLEQIESDLALTPRPPE